MKDFQFFLWEIPPVKGILREPMGVNEGFVLAIGMYLYPLETSQEAVITYSRLKPKPKLKTKQTKNNQTEPTQL